MLCPRCNSNQVDEVKFCTVCGANLEAVRHALENRPPGDDFNWGDTWLAEMFMSSAQQRKRRLALERASGITPEMKRFNEIKAGVITASAGIGVAIFLFVFMQGIILANPDTDAQAILSRLWIAGVIPFFVGLALIVNGVFVSKKYIESVSRQNDQNRLEGGTGPRSLRPADTNEFLNTPFSVTEQTTKHLRTSDRK
jgi:hypothetical protein